MRQLAAYYMMPPDQVSEWQVQEYLLYVRDELGCPKGTFFVTWAGIKFFYYRTLGYDWPLLTKKKSKAPSGAIAGCALGCSQRKAFADITACCTRELGGRLYQCEGCTETCGRSKPGDIDPQILRYLHEAKGLEAGLSWMVLSR